jgi:hypothetical protein
MPVAPSTIYAKRFALPGKLVVADVCGFILVKCEAFLIRKFKLKEKLQNVVGSAAHVTCSYYSELFNLIFYFVMFEDTTTKSY